MGLETVELVMAIEEEFDIQILNEDAANLETVGQLYHYVLATQKKHQSENTNHDLNAEVWQRVKNIVVYQLGVKPEQVVAEASFVFDLGAD